MSILLGRIETSMGPLVTVNLEFPVEGVPSRVGKDNERIGKLVLVWEGKDKKPRHAKATVVLGPDLTIRFQGQSTYLDTRWQWWFTGEGSEWRGHYANGNRMPGKLIDEVEGVALRLANMSAQKNRTEFVGLLRERVSARLLVSRTELEILTRNVGYLEGLLEDLNGELLHAGVREEVPPAQGEAGEDEGTDTGNQDSR